MYWFGNAFKLAFAALASGKTWKVMLLTDAYALDQAHDYANDLTGSQIAAGGGYTTGGIALSNVTLTYSDGMFLIDADDWFPPGLTATARYAAVYLDTGSAATSPVIGVSDLTEVDGETVTLTGLPVSPSGLLAVQIPLEGE